MHPKQLFVADANRSKVSILAVKPHWYRSLAFGGEVDYGYKMYVNCFNASLGMLVLGDESIRGDKKLLTNLGATSVTTSGPAVQAINSNSPTRLHQGAVLNEKYWWPFFNDCWVMGGVHGKHEFHLGHSDWPKDSELWDARNSRPKMLGRELLILSICGYEVRKSALGMVFYNSDHMKAFNLRLTSIYALRPGNNKVAFIKRIKGAF